MGDEVITERLFNVPCPKCGAPIGKPCSNWEGYPSACYPERHIAAEKVAAAYPPFSKRLLEMDCGQNDCKTCAARRALEFHPDDCECAVCLTEGINNLVELRERTRTMLQKLLGKEGK